MRVVAVFLSHSGQEREYANFPKLQTILVSISSDCVVRHVWSICFQGTVPGGGATPAW